MLKTTPSGALRALLWSGLIGAASVSGCAEDTGDSDPGCVPGTKCDSAAVEAFQTKLEGREDALARWLRNSESGGVVEGDYATVLDGVGQELGCDLSTERTYSILLTRAGLFPRHIMARCADDPVKASQLFLTTQSDYVLDDIDPQQLKVIAWDATARMYRRYEITSSEEGGPMEVTVDPPECLLCHTGSTELDRARMPFMPIMNELVNPWTLWNAEPEFRSHQFEEAIDLELLEQPVYQEMTADGKLDSAANFEKHIRAAMDRVTGARLRARRDPADLDASLALIRPLFCDETLNYVSENHFTGETAASIIIDDAIRRIYLDIDATNWPWDWVQDGVLRLPELAEDETTINVMPVRGEADIQIETGLVSRNVVAPELALRIRALDWQKPALSDFRCNLFLSAEERMRITPPDLSGFERNSDAIPSLIDAILQIRVQNADTGEFELVPLAASAEGSFIAIPDAGSEDAIYALSSGDLSAYEITLEGFGDALEARFTESAGDGFRGNLEEERMRRGCRAVHEYPSSPRIPGTDTCQP